MADDPDPGDCIPEPPDYACRTCTWAGADAVLSLVDVRCPRCGGECYPCEEDTPLYVPHDGKDVIKES